MQQKLLKKTALFCLLFTIAALALICDAAAHKVIVIAGVAQDMVKDRNEDKETVPEERGSLLFANSRDNGKYLCIPLKEGIRAEMVSIENHYRKRELWVIFEGDCGGFYKENPIAGNYGKIKDGYYVREGKRVKLKFSLTGIYEYRSILEENSLYIEFLPPKEMYERIVVIDAAGGGEVPGRTAGGWEEKDITLKIVRKLKNKLDASGIKAYYTRIEDVYLSEEDRVRLANEIKADMLIRIEADVSADAGNPGTTAVYNADYFLPEFDSIDLADLLEREVVTAAGGKAAGLVPAGEEAYVLRQATVPAAAISIDYNGGEETAEHLKNDGYLEKIAEGIYSAIMKAYE